VTRVVVRRILLTPLLLLVIASGVFFLLRLGPFSPDSLLEAVANNPDRVAEMREFWGVDDPLFSQYTSYLANLSQADFGRSFQDNQEISEIILERLPATIELAVVSLILGGLIGVSLGTLAALRANTWIDTTARSVALAGVSLPAFLVGLALIYLFAVKLHWLPAGGRGDSRLESDSITGFYFLDGLLNGRLDVYWDSVRHILMPAFVLALFVAGFIARVTRTTMIDVLSQEYVRSALARGNGSARAVVRHALPNTLLPLVTLLGLLFGLLLGGAAIVETVFSYPGMGKLLVDAIRVRDYPQIQASIVILAGIYIFVNLAVDVLYGYIDPRIRTGDVSIG
jgi:peptide/nickel transport system permease protein